MATRPARDPYLRSARIYDRLIEPQLAALRDIGLGLHPGREGQRVLDIGCGTGTFLDLYQRRGAIVSGIDSSPAMLAEARQKLGQRAELVGGSGARLPFAQQSFDLVILTMILHELHPNVRWGVVQEAKRVCAPGGRLLCIDFHPGPYRLIKGWFRRGVINLIEAMAGHVHYYNHRRFLSTGGIGAVAVRHQLTVVHHKIVGGGTMGVFVLGVEENR